MTIYEQLLAVFSGSEEQTLTSEEIKERVVARFGTNPTSVIPSDYCYNRRNATMGDRQHLFEYLEKSHYLYLGPGRRYNGPIMERPRGCAEDRQCGEWVDGMRRMLPFSDAKDSR